MVSLLSRFFVLSPAVLHYHLGIEGRVGEALCALDGPQLNGDGVKGREHKVGGRGRSLAAVVPRGFGGATAVLSDVVGEQIRLRTKIAVESCKSRL